MTYTPPEIQLARLMVNRKMSEAEARQRIAAQPPQEQKLAAANMVIRNDSSFEETWKQVTAAWKRLVPKMTEAAQDVKTRPLHRLPQGELSVMRGKPRDSEAIAGLINRAQTAEAGLAR